MNFTMSRFERLYLEPQFFTSVNLDFFEKKTDIVIRSTKSFRLWCSSPSHLKESVFLETLIAITNTVK